MSQEKVEGERFPKEISFVELYKLVQKNVLDTESLANRLGNVEASLKGFTEAYIISNKFSEQEAVEISKSASELMRTLSAVLTDLAGKNIVAEVRFDAKAGVFGVQFFKYEGKSGNGSD
jgi:hypothetical protein